MSAGKPYLSIVSHYEACLERHGDCALGVDWPNPEDAATRYAVMLDVIRARDATEPVRLLDFGCGASHLYQYILDKGITNIDYCGLDLSPRFIELARRKYPAVEYYQLDILDAEVSLPRFDYVVLNGVFTEKRELSSTDMFSYVQQVLRRVFALAEIGIAFNVMSPHVDWTRDDLFHLSHDALAAFLTSELTRDYVMRCDYELYEYTTYAYRRSPGEDAGAPRP